MITKSNKWPLSSVSSAADDASSGSKRLGPGGWAWESKAALERALALLLFIILLPALLLVGLAVVIDSRGGPLFVQPRFGKDGVPFGVLKFRTMSNNLSDRSGANQTEDNDPRITRIGWFLRSTSIDELPQLWNIVAGQMALIGPRAHPCGMAVEGRLCTDLVPDYHDRHVVRPGITGWAQVNGSRGAVKSLEALERRLSLDLCYIDNWSPVLDLRILLRTVAVVVSRENAR